MALKVLLWEKQAASRHITESGGCSHRRQMLYDSGAGCYMLMLIFMLNRREGRCASQLCLAIDNKH